jgi:Holliday junction resolvase RusA-like endonuclease
MTHMSAEEIERGLVAQGVPLEKARLVALRAPVDGNPLAAPPAGVIHAPRSVALPFRMTVPWSELCSDNEKEVGSLTRLANGTMIARKKLTARYKTSKEAIRNRAKAIVKDAHPVSIPLAIQVDVWLPPSRRNDAINFAKVCGDALEGVVYENDNQLHDARWRRMGTDIDRPRAEITLSPL